MRGFFRIIRATEGEEDIWLSELDRDLFRVGGEDADGVLFLAVLEVDICCVFRSALSCGRHS